MKKQLQLLFLILIVSIQTNAQMGAALNFDGSNDYAMTGSNITHGNQFTYEAWIKPMSANAWGGIMTTSSLAGESQWIQITLNNAGALRAEIVDDSGNNKWYEGNSLLVGAWHHIAISFDGTNLLFYVDGNVENTSAINNGTLGNMTINSQLNIGAERNHNVFYNGDIDEVRVWNTVRTRCEIISYMGCEIPSSSAGLIANYHFNQGIDAANNTAETMLMDFSGNAIDGVLNNFSLSGSASNWIAPGGVVSGFTTTAVCTPGAALNFDGADDYVGSITPANIPVGNSPYTIEANIKPTTLGVEGIAGWGTYGTTNQVNALRLDASGNIINYWWGPDLIVSSSPVNMADGNWHHIAATFDGTTRKIYLDGVLKGSDIPGGHSVPNGANFRIGSTNNGEFFNGGLDEVRIWDIARTQCEINSYMNCEIPSSAAGLIANYHFNQGVDAANNSFETALEDGSGNANNATLNNFSLSGSTSNWIAPGAVVSGSVTPTVCLPASALNLDGSNDFIEVPSGINVANQSFTMEFWAKRNGNGNGDYVISQQSSTSTNNALHIGFRDNNAFTFAFYGNDLDVNNPATTDGNYHHWTCVYNAGQTGSNRFIYLDGNLIASDYTSANYTGSGALYLGLNIFGGETFNGELDEVRIWNVARTNCEIISYMNSEIPTTASGLLANYHFNQGIATDNNSSEITLVDASGNGYNGMLNNFALTNVISNWVAPGAVFTGSVTPAICPLAAALDFDGVNDGVDLGNSIDSILDPLNTITVEAWVNPSTTTWLGVIAGNYNTSGSGMQFLLRRDFNEYAFWVDAGNGFQVVTSGVATVSLGIWQHIAGVWNGSELSIYIDGVLKNTVTGVTGSSFISSINNVEIGHNNVNENFMGTIDEARIWSIARTQCEINTYKNCEIPSSSAGLLANFNFNQGLNTYSNPTETNLIDASGNGYDGTLNNFALTGTTSNWVAPGGVVSGYTTTLAPSTITVNSGTICTGQSFTMIPSGANTYTYSNGSDVVMPSTDATYTVSGTALTGCPAIDALASVTVNSSPTVTVNSGAVCAGQSFTMTPTGAVTYTYSNGSNVVMPTVDASYTLTGTDANGCENMAISTVTVNALPTLMAVTNNTLLCTGQTATLSVMGASTYTWSTTENTSDIAVSPTVQTTYTVNGTDANGCSNTTTVTQDVSLCTGVAQLINSSSLISIYPNPNNGIFTIKSEVNITLSLMNDLGQVLQTIKLDGFNDRTLPLENISNGMYYICGQDGNQSVKQKIIVIR